MLYSVRFSAVPPSKLYFIAYVFTSHKTLKVLSPVVPFFISTSVPKNLSLSHPLNV